MKKKSVIFLIVLMLFTVVVSVCACTTQNITEYPVLENANFAFEKVVSDVLGSTVTITCKVSSGVQGGSGVVVSSDGYILTNYHVVQGAIGNSAKVMFVNEDKPDYGVEYEAEILAEKNDGTKYAKMDLAVLKIKSLNSGLSAFTPVKLKSEKVVWGECGVIIGNPKQLGSMCAHAMVSNPSREMAHKITTTIGKTKEVNLVTDFITIDAPVNPGNSGGGFFDSKGNLAGIVTLRQYDQSSANINVVFGIGYAIPASSIKGYLARYDINL